MRKANFQLSKESFEDMSRAGRFNRSLEITFRDRTGVHTHKISAGYSDDIEVYREHSITYVLSQNRALPYIGLEAFEGSAKVGDLFLQEGQVEEALGAKGCDLAPFTIIRRLSEYVLI